MADDAAKIQEIASDPKFKEAVEQGDALTRVKRLSLPIISDRQFALAKDKVEADMREVAKTHGVNLFSEESRTVRDGLAAYFPETRDPQFPTKKDFQIATDLVQAVQKTREEHLTSEIATSTAFKRMEEQLGAVERVHNAKGMSDEQFQQATEQLRFDKKYIEETHGVRETDFRAVEEGLKREFLKREDVTRPASLADIETVGKVMKEVEEKSYSGQNLPEVIPLKRTGFESLSGDPRFQEAAASWKSLQSAGRENIGGGGEASQKEGAELEAKARTIAAAMGHESTSEASTAILDALKSKAAVAGDDKSHVPSNDDWQKASAAVVTAALKDYNGQHSGNEGAAHKIPDARGQEPGRAAAIGV